MNCWVMPGGRFGIVQLRGENERTRVFLVLVRGGLLRLPVVSKAEAVIRNIWRIPLGIGAAVGMTVRLVLIAFVILPWAFLRDLWAEILGEE